MNQNELEFARICAENNIRALDTPAKIEKAKLIAQTKSLVETSDIQYLEDTLREYAQLVEEETNSLKKEEITKKKRQEEKQKALFEKYGSLHGREKPQQYYQDLIDQVDNVLKQEEDARKAAQTVRDVYSALAKSTVAVKSSPEQDWAIAGGFASALAGPAAGLAVASDIQRKNAASRIDPVAAEESAARARAAYYAQGNSLAAEIMKTQGVNPDDLRDARRTKRKYLEIQESIKIKLVEDKIDPHCLLNLLNPVVTAITQTESGTVVVDVGIDGRYYRIFEEVSAVIDGSFKGILWNSKHEYCGVMTFVLPVTGASFNMKLTGISTYPDNFNETYSVTFSSPNLWLIESGSSNTGETVNCSSEDILLYREADSYCKAIELMQSGNTSDLRRAQASFEQLGAWNDSAVQAKKCNRILQEIERNENEKAELERLRQEEVQRKLQESEIQKGQKKKKTIKRIIAAVCIIAIGVTACLTVFVFVPKEKYSQAEKMLIDGEYEDAIAAFEKLGNYSDSQTRVTDCIYRWGKALYDQGQLEEAMEKFSSVENYGNAKGMISKINSDVEEMNLKNSYQIAKEMLSNQEYEKAFVAFSELGDYLDSAEQATETAILLGDVYWNNGDYDNAEKWYIVGKSENVFFEKEYEYIKAHFNTEDELTRRFLRELRENEYEDSATLLFTLYPATCDIIINDDRSDGTTSKSSLQFTQLNYTGYAHYVIHCDALQGESISIKCEIEKCDKSTSRWSTLYGNEWSADEGKMYCDQFLFTYDNAVKFRIYNAETGEEIGNSSVSIIR